MLNKLNSKIRYFRLRAAFTIIVIPLLTACGSSGGGTGAGDGSSNGGNTGGTPDTGPPANDTTPTTPTGSEGDHQFYYSSSIVHAINTNDPANPIPVAPARGSGYVVYQGSYDSTTHTVNALAPHTAVWLANVPDSNNAFRFDGVIFKASAQRPFDGETVVSSGSFTYKNPTTRRSSDYCGMNLVVDWANPDDSQLFYWLAGSNLQCSSGMIEVDDTMHMVRLGDDETTAPVNVPSDYLGPLRDPDTGAIAGWIVHQGSSYYRASATFAFDLSSKIQGASGWNQLLASAPNGDYLILKQTGAETAIVKYSMNSNTDLGTVFSRATDSTNFIAVSRWISDETNLYFFVRDSANGLILYRLPLSATGLGEAQIMAQEPAGFIRLFTVSDNAIFYEWEDTSSSSSPVPLKFVEKTAAGSNPGQAIDTPDTVAQFDTNATAGLFYNFIGADGTYYASIIGDNGSYIARYDNAAWRGSIQHQRNLYSLDHSSYKILVSNIAQGGGFGGASISIFDNQSSQLSASFGVLDEDIVDLGNIYSFGDNVLVNANVEYTSPNSDLLFFNIGDAGSIQRLTNTPDVNEYAFQLAR
jgi:hypothetical protein